MKKHRLVFLVLFAWVSCILLGCGITSASESETDIPQEFTSCIETALDALKQSGKESLPYSYFPNDSLRAARETSPEYLLSYSIESTEKVNDDLYAFKVLVEGSYSPGEQFEIYKFAGRINDEILYIGNAAWIPENLQDGFDAEKYSTALRENDLSSDAILFNIQ